MREVLKTFQPFRNLDAGAMEALAAQARLVRLPPGRTLMRAGQKTTRDLYLYSGTVSIRHAGRARRLDAAEARERALGAHPADEILTVTAVEAVAVDRAAVRALSGHAPPPAPETGAPDAWIPDFLSGPVMRWFSPGTWAWVVRAGEVRELDPGDRLFVRGQVPDELFVVVRGAAECGGERFKPGDAIGADRALTRTPLDADAVVTAAGVFLRFSRDSLLELIDDYRPPDADAPVSRLDLDTIPPAEEAAAIAGLDRNRVICVRGADRNRRAAVASKLMQEGFVVT